MTHLEGYKIYDYTKRIIDLLSSIFGLLLLFPLLLLIAIFVKLDSKGPIVYKGIRTGLNSVSFEIYKFRTMVHNAEKIGGLVTAKDDSRVTRFGKIIRKYKLDELPQLINVLKGEMSIVGPRPEVPLYTSLYTKEEEIILTVRPGITDFSSILFVQLGDVVGSNGDKKQFDNKIQNILRTKNKLRIKYVNERSFVTDLKIIIMTIVRLLKSF